VLDVIAETPEFLVANKPQDLVCHPTKGDAYSSLISRARLHLDGPAFLVNRLDRETSGLVLIAKSSEWAGELARQLETGAVLKEYVAIVHGCPAQQNGTIDAPLGKDDRSAVAIKDCVRPDGKPARTDFIVESSLTRAGNQFSLLRVIPASGRKHQIRIHLSHIGHPIVGDKIYGPDEQIYLRFVEKRITEEDWKRLILPNHALHAGKLAFRWRERDWRFTASMPAQLAEFSAER
jgi:23S rRNA pseudouridine1911/1915/1917 synthase